MPVRVDREKHVIKESPMCEHSGEEKKQSLLSVLSVALGLSNGDGDNSGNSGEGGTDGED